MSYAHRGKVKQIWYKAHQPVAPAAYSRAWLGHRNRQLVIQKGLLSLQFAQSETLNVAARTLGGASLRRTGLAEILANLKLNPGITSRAGAVSRRAETNHLDGISGGSQALSRHYCADAAPASIAPFANYWSTAQWKEHRRILL